MSENDTKEDSFKKPAQMPVASEKPVSEATETVKKPAPSTPQTCKYDEPSWKMIPPKEKKYHLEVIKGGTTLEPIDLCTGRSYFVVGRMVDCQIPLQHPSLSRYHAVLQYGRQGSKEGWYIFELGSSNGTVVNKIRLPPSVYRPLEIGHVIKFGMSTRLLVLQGIADETTDQAEEQEVTQRKIQVAKVAKVAKKPEQKKEDDNGCMWGISMDDEAVYASAEVDPNFASDSDPSDNEHGEKKARKPLDLSDPKKTLRAYFEREDLGMPEYNAENIGKNKFRATIDVPTDSGIGGKTIRVEGEGFSKKEAVAACAKEACITLDRMDILRPKHNVGRKKEKSKDWAANDYYDSDEDSFFDRTGELEQKRQKRMQREQGLKKATGSSGNVHNEESLTKDIERLGKEISEIQTKLADDEKKRAEFQKQRNNVGGELDELESYMKALKQGVAMDATTRVRLKHRLLEIQKEKAKCERLLKIAAGPKMPASLMVNSLSSKSKEPPVTEQAKPKIQVNFTNFYFKFVFITFSFSSVSQ